MIFEEIKIALNDLPEEQRIVFEQTEFGNVPVKEIAGKPNTPVNTILSRKYYAVKFLRKRLKELYADIITEE
jgi:DNA-directed RNA polymerase specialized sigma24 family protein